MKKIGKKHLALVERAKKLNEKFNNGDKIELSDLYDSKGCALIYPMIIATSVLENAEDFHKELIENLAKYEISKTEKLIPCYEGRKGFEGLLEELKSDIRKAEVRKESLLEYSSNVMGKNFSPVCKEIIAKYNLAV